MFLNVIFRRATALTTLSTPVHGSANATVTFNREASLSCQANCTYVDSDDTNGPSAGDTISYVFGIENNGTTTVWSMGIDSGFVGPVVCSPPLESLELAPGGKTECTSTYQASRKCMNIGFDVTVFAPIIDDFPDTPSQYLLSSHLCERHELSRIHAPRTEG